MAEAEHVLKSRAFRQAVAGIQRRAEKQTDWAKLDQVFVRSDLFDRVQSPDSQLMLGRRGTGKTHLVRVFQQHATEHGVTSFFSQLLYNHLGVELAWDLDVSAEEKRRFVISQIFTQERSFVELVRAAEGNSRDFLCIFSRSYFDEFRRSSMSAAVSIPNVVAAAISWYDSEKASNVYAEPTARETLTYLMNQVLKGYKSPTFLVESSKAESPIDDRGSIRRITFDPDSMAVVGDRQLELPGV